MKGLIFLLILSITSLLFSQDNLREGDLNNQMDKLDSMFLVNFNQLYKDTSLSISNNFVEFLATINSVKKTELNLKTDVIQAKKDVLNSDKGLSLNAGYLDNQLSNVFDLEDNINFKRRVLTTLQWNILNSGLIENQNKAKALDYQLQYEGLKLQNQTDKDLYLQRFNQTIVVFNEEKINLINTRKSLMSQLYDIEQELYLKKRINKDELLDVQLRRAEIAGLIQVYGAYNELSSFNSKAYGKGYNSIPLFDLNYNLLFEKFKDVNVDSISQTFYEEAELLNQWYNSVGLSLFTRHNFYQVIVSQEILDRSFMSIGVNLSIPLNFNNGKRRDLKIAQINYKLNDLQKQKNIYEEELLNDLYEFRYKLKQYISFYYKLKEFEELIRIEEVKRKLKSTYFSPIKAIKLIDDYLQIQMELVDIKQNMYLKLIRIHEKVPSIAIQDLVKPFYINKLNNKIEKVDRSIYVWSSIFNTYDSDFLTEYITYNDLNHVILAVKQDDKLFTKKETFINSLAQKGNTISLMFGQNKMIDVVDVSNWCDKSLKGYDLSKIKGIHLDVEPHTFDDWKENKESLIQKYIELLKRVSEYCKLKDLELEVSLPVYYPIENMLEIFSIVDQVYFMCYENIDQDYLIRKLSPFSDLKSKYTISLRMEDFENRDVMEVYAQEIIKKIGSNKVTFHDLKRILLKDEAELKK